MSETPAQRWRRLSTVWIPLLLVAIVVVFLIERPKPLTGPPPAAIAAAAAQPCRLFTSGEMGVFLEARIVERVPDTQPPRQMCSYHGDAESAGTVVEIGIISPEDLRRDRGRRFRPADLLTEVKADQPSDVVQGVGDEAVYLPEGSGQLWARDGDLVITVTVLRQSTEGDRAAANRLARVVLEKIAAMGRGG